MKRNGLHRKKPQCAKAAARSKESWNGTGWRATHDVYWAVYRWHRAVRNARHAGGANG